MVCDRVSGMSANARTGVRAGPLAKQDCNDAVATDEVREASRSHAFDSPLPGEGREPERQVSMWVAVSVSVSTYSQDYQGDSNGSWTLSSR
jgi:hypothetical protein